MNTTVNQTYTPSLNVSVTEKDGAVTRVTLWVTGAPSSTNVIVDK